MDSMLTGKTTAAPIPRPVGLGAFVVVVCLLFLNPLLDLVRYAATSDLYSHVLLVPFISLYLVWLKRKDQPRPMEGSPGLASILFLAGLSALIAFWMSNGQGAPLNRNDRLALLTFAFLTFIVGGCLAFLGQRVVRANLFAVGFLFLMIPLPTALVDLTNGLLQRSSAEVSYVLLRCVGIPVFKQGVVFDLPGIVIQVAEQCSGIHSTLVLFISSLLAGRYFLKSPWRRTVLTLAILPIGIVRNGLRIFLLAVLCVRVGPEMIHSPLHTYGGQPFFALSLALLIALLLVLRKSEQRKRTQTNRRES
jgi:exosortase C (VPDSG-CTERM-specific)